jgi:hypothetical protein
MPRALMAMRRNAEESYRHVRMPRDTGRERDERGNNAEVVESEGKKRGSPGMRETTLS